MKRADLVREVERAGCVLVRRGAKHDWYRNPVTGVFQPVPRHREIKQSLANHILKMLSHPAEGRSTSASRDRRPT